MTSNFEKHIAEKYILAFVSFTISFKSYISDMKRSATDKHAASKAKQSIFFKTCSCFTIQVKGPSNNIVQLANRFNSSRTWLLTCRCCWVFFSFHLIFMQVSSWFKSENDGTWVGFKQLWKFWGKKIKNTPQKPQKPKNPPKTETNQTENK